jgi:hypothetical protein
MNSLTQTPKLLDDKALGSDLPFLQSRRRRRGLGGLEVTWPRDTIPNLDLAKTWFPTQASPARKTVASPNFSPILAHEQNLSPTLPIRHKPAHTDRETLFADHSPKLLFANAGMHEE